MTESSCDISAASLRAPVTVDNTHAAPLARELKRRKTAGRFFFVGVWLTSFFASNYRHLVSQSRPTAAGVRMSFINSIIQLFHHHILL